MYAAPPSITAEVFAVIPEAIGYGNRRSDWADAQINGVATPTYLEGPCFDAAGNLWVTDIPWGRLLKVTPAGEVSVGAEYDGLPNGLKFLADGRGVIADFKHGLMVFDPATGAVEPYLTRRLLEPFHGCNDLTVASNGDLYFTDQGMSGLHAPYGKVYRLRVDGRLDQPGAGPVVELPHAQARDPRGAVEVRVPARDQREIEGAAPEVAKEGGEVFSRLRSEPDRPLGCRRHTDDAVDEPLP